jgi:tetratricopeptide (TPR) repeat protein
MEEPRMTIRFGLVLAMATLFGTTGCASGGGGGGSGVTGGGGAASGSEVARPRETDSTRAAERALDAGDGASDEAEAQMHYQQALTSAEAAIAEDSTNALAYRLAALAALGTEDYQAAGGYFDRAAELYPLYEFEDAGIRERTWIDLYQQAAPLVEAGDYEAAVQVFENANAIFDDRPEALFTLGQLYAQLRQHDQSIENLDAAMAFMQSDAVTEVDSATAAAWQEQAAEIPMLRAQVLADAGRFEEAAAAYRGLAAEDPTNLDLVRGLATILMQMGDEAAALEVYEDLLTRPGLTAQDYYAIGVGFYQANDYDQASTAFGRAAEASPRDRDALEMWARSAQLDSAFAVVPDVAERWIELDPNSQNAYLILAQAANQLGDQATTREAVQAVEGLEVAMDQLQLQRYASGGGAVSGSVMNKTLDAGQSVTLTFTFYGTGGSPIGTVTETVTVAAPDMAQVINVEFDSTELVSGYGYELTVG